MVVQDSLNILAIVITIDGQEVGGLDIPYQSGIDLTPERFQAQIVQAFADWIRLKNLGPDGTES